MDADAYAEILTSFKLGGVIFRPVKFLPTFQKYANQTCNGVFLHVVDRSKFEPVITGLAMVKTAFDMYPEEFSWKTADYEYAFNRNPFDVIAGTKKIRKSFENGTSIKELQKSWSEDERSFAELRKDFLLYH